MSESKPFGELFKKLRLQAGIATLKDLGNLLAERGYVYEDSFLSHWQKGRKIPQNRKVLLTIIRIIAEQSKQINIEEINMLLNLAGQGYLTVNEEEELNKIATTQVPFLAPHERSEYISREAYLKDICWFLLSNKNVLLSGVPGNGKTVLALKTAHFLKDKYPDGVLWYRMDIKSFSDVLDNIADIYKENVTNIPDISVKINHVNKIIKNKKLLLIFDNVETFEYIDKLLHGAKQYNILLTSIHSPHHKNDLVDIRLSGFTQEEALFLSNRILGKPYVTCNVDKLLELYSFLNYSPLGISVLLARLVTSPTKLQTISEQLQKQKLGLTEFSYDNKELIASLELAYESLDKDLQLFFITLSIFNGPDFTIEAVSHMNNISLSNCKKKLNELYKFSLIEKSVEGRFRLHPLVKVFVKSKFENNGLFQKLASYYIGFISLLGKHNSPNYYLIEKEVENIAGIYEKCYALGYYKEVQNLWEVFGIFLWDTGRWLQVDNYAKFAIKASEYLNDKKFKAECLVKELGWLHYWKGNYTLSQEYLEEGIKTAKLIDDDILIALGNQKLSLILQMKHKNKKALVLLINTLKILKKYKMTDDIADTYLCLGDVYTAERDYKNAMISYKKAIKYGEQVKEHSAEARAFYHLAEVYLLENDLKTAKILFDKSFLIDSKRNRIPGIASCYYAFGRISIKEKNYFEAKESLKKARKLFEQIQMQPHLSQVEEELANLKKITH